jgi:hypothetical protein
VEVRRFCVLPTLTIQTVHIVFVVPFKTSDCVAIIVRRLRAWLGFTNVVLILLAPTPNRPCLSVGLTAVGYCRLHTGGGLYSCIA